MCFTSRLPPLHHYGAVRARHAGRDRVAAIGRTAVATIRAAIVIDLIITAIADMQSRPDASPLSLRPRRAPPDGNEFCLFTKPWTTHPGVDLRAVFTLLLDTVTAHGLRIDEVAVLPGAVLRRHRTMHAHYWRMTQAATTARDAFTAAVAARFAAAFGCGADDARVLGGFEFLDRYPAVSSAALELLWENAAQHSLGPSIAGARIKVGNDQVYLVNGFVPRLLETYALPESVVVVFALSGPLDWGAARQCFAGHTDPMRAAPGSLRNALYVHRAELGLANLRLGANGVHLSAGPVEALAELQRLLSLGAPERPRTHAAFAFGRALDAVLGHDAATRLLSNPSVLIDGRSSSIFDATEGLDAREALLLLEGFRDQLALPRAAIAAA